MKVNHITNSKPAFPKSPTFSTSLNDFILPSAYEIKNHEIITIVFLKKYEGFWGPATPLPASSKPHLKLARSYLTGAVVSSPHPTALTAPTP